jgi:hypothetical protein
MRSNRSTLIVFVVALATLARGAANEGGFVDQFEVKRENFVATGRSDLLILEPGYEHEYQTADGSEKLLVTVLEETKVIDGVETRTVEEREWKDGRLAEVSRNYFAIDRATGDAYYFGEEVDDYKDGRVVGHGGAWRAGENGARFGLFMPAAPKVGQKFYQEVAPKVAMDRVEIASVSETVQVPAGKFENCVKTNETTPLEPGALEHKLYAAKVGLISDGDLKLVRHGPRRK